MYILLATKTNYNDTESYVYKFDSEEKRDEAAFKLRKCGYECSTKFTKYTEPVKYYHGYFDANKQRYIVKEDFNEFGIDEFSSNIPNDDVLRYVPSYNCRSLDKSKVYEWCDRANEHLSKYQLVKTSGPSSGTYHSWVLKTVQEFQVERDIFNLQGQLIRTGHILYRNDKIFDGNIKYPPGPFFTGCSG